MKNMNKGKKCCGENKSPATIKGGQGNKSDVMSTMKDCGSYSKKYGNIGGKSKAAK